MVGLSHSQVSAVPLEKEYKGTMLYKTEFKWRAFANLGPIKASTDPPHHLRAIWSCKLQEQQIY